MLILRICSLKPSESRGIEIPPSSHKKLGFQPDRGRVSDLSDSGDKSDLVVFDPHDPTTTSKLETPMQSLNQLPVLTDPVGARLA
jgi:hypothetical protein